MSGTWREFEQSARRSGNKDLQFASGKLPLFQSLIRQARAIGRFSAIRITRCCRRSAPGLADRGRANRPGCPWARRHQGQQARRRWRHPKRHLPAPAIVVARRPPSAAAYVLAGSRHPARRRLVRRSAEPPLQSAGAAGSRPGRRPAHSATIISTISSSRSITTTRPRIAGRGSAVFLHLAREPILRRPPAVRFNDQRARCCGCCGGWGRGRGRDWVDSAMSAGIDDLSFLRGREALRGQKSPSRRTCVAPN